MCRKCIPIGITLDTCTYSYSQLNTHLVCTKLKVVYTQLSLLILLALSATQGWVSNSNIGNAQLNLLPWVHLRAHSQIAKMGKESTFIYNWYLNSRHYCLWYHQEKGLVFNFMSLISICVIFVLFVFFLLDGQICTLKILGPVTFWLWTNELWVWDSGYLPKRDTLNKATECALSFIKTWRYTYLMANIQLKLHPLWGCRTSIIPTYDPIINKKRTPPTCQAGTHNAPHQPTSSSLDHTDT